MSNDRFESQIIGRLTHNYRNRENVLLKNEILKNSLKQQSEIQFVNLKSAQIEVHVPDHKDLIIILNESNILLYDKRFVLLRNITTINGQTFRALSITSTKTNHIYYMSTIDNKILMVDPDFNLLKSIGTFGTEVLI
jgi:hypothetical protein